jgi:hypothetical protein
LRNTFSKPRVTYKQITRSAILHHGGKFRPGQSRIERHNNRPFRHQRQVYGYPLDRVRAQERAAIAGLQAKFAQARAHPPHLLQQLATSHVHKLPAAHFTQDDVIRCFLQMFKYVFQKSFHCYSAPGRDRHCRCIVLFHQLSQVFVERR